MNKHGTILVIGVTGGSKRVFVSYVSIAMCSPHQQAFIPLACLYILIVPRAFCLHAACASVAQGKTAVMQMLEALGYATISGDRTAHTRCEAPTIDACSPPSQQAEWPYFVDISASLRLITSDASYTL